MMSSTDEETGVQVILTNLEENPQCPHGIVIFKANKAKLPDLVDCIFQGPTLLFKRPSEARSFYACSACRDRKDCKFFQWADVAISKNKQKLWDEEKQKLLPQLDHDFLTERFKQMWSLPVSQRMYCHTCNSLVKKDERNAHSNHDLLPSVTDYQLHHPSQLMKPQESSRKEAQYLFAAKSTKVIVDILKNAGLSRVLCIGAPRIHEYIRFNLKDSMTSLLLDIDHRYHQFYTRDEFCWFNSFNCHFFEAGGKEVLDKFLAGGKSNDMAIVTDPPFGGRVEPLSHTLKKIDEWHLKLHPKRKDKLAGPKGRKQGSPVRIFTSLNSKFVKFPAEDGYRLCEICERWVSSENKHCFKCESCTSKDGRTYVHCDPCGRCVKPTWEHCSKCNRCCLPKHNCGFSPQVGLCFACHQPGHKKTDCPQRTTQDQGANRMRTKKRKNPGKPNNQSRKKKSKVTTV